MLLSWSLPVLYVPTQTHCTTSKYAHCFIDIIKGISLIKKNKEKKDKSRH